MQWEIVSEQAWIVISQGLKYYKNRYLTFKSEFENFGTVTRSKAGAYREIEEKMLFNRRRLEKYAKKRREQIENIEKIREEVTEYGVVLPPFRLTLDDAKDLKILGEFVKQANMLRRNGHELAVYEGRGELTNCLEDNDENLIIRRQFRRG